MAIISTETNASAASSGTNKELSFNLSDQRETYQGPAEDNNAYLIKAERISLSLNSPLHRFPSLHCNSRVKMWDNNKSVRILYIPELICKCVFIHPQRLLPLIICFPYV